MKQISTVFRERPWILQLLAGRTDFNQIAQEVFKGTVLPETNSSIPSIFKI